MKTALSIFIVGLLGFSAQIKGATTYYVATNGVESADGLDWTTALASISNALFKATNGSDVVVVSNGTYLLSAQIELTTNVRVRSWNNGLIDCTNTIINGHYATVTNRCVYMNSTGAVLEGFTITNGYCVDSSLGGGGVCMLNGLITNCIISGNISTGFSGGGVYMSGGAICDSTINGNSSTNYGGGLYVTNSSINNCTVSRNRSWNNGGGIYMLYGGIISNCTVFSNRVTHPMSSDYGGGGIFCVGGTIWGCRIFTNGVDNHCGGGGVYFRGGNGIIRDSIISNDWGGYGGGINGYYGCVVSNCTIVQNYGSVQGGGIFCYQEQGMRVNSCKIINNTCNNGHGGGIAAWYDLKIANCLIANNRTQVSGNGGGIYAYNLCYGRGLIESCTIVSNTSVGYGGGIVLESVVYGSQAYSNAVTNCVVYLNTATLGGNDIYDLRAPTNSSTVGYSCMSDTNQFTGPGNFTNDPRFISPASTNYRLAEGSPCIDRGINRAWMNGAVDLDGNSRIFYNRTDVGAYEYRFSGMIFYMH